MPNISKVQFFDENNKVIAECVGNKAQQYYESKDMLTFEYALKFPNGLYYTGEVNSETNPNAWQGPKHKAFTYTLAGAYRKLDSLNCFRECWVERVL